MIATCSGSMSGVSTNRKRAEMRLSAIRAEKKRSATFSPTSPESREPSTCLDDHRELRPYQWDTVAFAVRALEGNHGKLGKHVIIDEPTGAGKTVEAVAIIALTLKPTAFTHILFVTSQRQIEDSITERDYSTISFPGPEGSAGCIHLATDNLIDPAGVGPKRDKDRRKAISTYCQSKGQQTRAMAATYYSLSIKALPQSCVRHLLIVDEGHYGGAKGLGGFIKEFAKRGGRVLYFTATPYRGNDTPMHDFSADEIVIKRRSPAQHAAEGFAPERVEPMIIPVRRAFLVPKERVYGIEAPQTEAEAEAIAKAAVETWLADGRPKAMFRVPPRRQGHAGVLIACLIKALRKVGARVFDASGEGVKQQQKFIELLRAERCIAKDGRYEDSQVDVIVGIQRLKEGTDWPFCAAVYNYGLPQRMNTAVQLLGRGNRLKKPDHPHRDRVLFRCFIEINNDESLANLVKERAAEDAWAFCCVLGDTQSPLQWGLEKEAIEQIHEQVKDRQKRIEIEARLTGQDQAIFKRYEAMLKVGALLGEEASNTSKLAKGVSKGAPAKSDPKSAPKPAPKPVANIAVVHEMLQAEHGEDVATDLLGRLIYDGAQGEEKEEIRKEYRRAIGTSHASEIDILAVQKNFFRSLIQRLKDTALREGPVLRSVKTQFYSLTHTTIREIAEATFGGTPLILGVVRDTWGENFLAKNGRYPTAADDDPDLPEGETWARIEAACKFQRRFTVLPAPKSLWGMFGGGKQKRILKLLQKIRRPMKRATIEAKLRLERNKAAGSITHLITTGYVQRDEHGLLAWTGRTEGPTSLHTRLTDKKNVWTGLLHLLRTRGLQFKSSHLAKAAKCNPKAMTMTVRSLQKDGYITRHSHGTWCINAEVLLPQLRIMGVL